MKAATLRRRSLVHYWRTNAAVVLGVATAAAVLAGSLVVGDSVRASLARLAVARLGRVAQAVEAPGFLREALADDAAAAPAITLRGTVRRQDGARSAGDVLVHGVDARYFALQGTAAPPGFEGRSAALSAALAEELQAAAGDAVVVLLPSADAIPGSTLFGRRDDPGRRLRATVRGVLPRAQGGELTLLPTQSAVRAVFVPLATLQATLGLAGRANTLLAAEEGEGLGRRVAAAATLEDLGLRLRAVPEKGELSLESARSLLDDRTVEAGTAAAHAAGLAARPVLIYLANAISAGGRAVPYSLVAAVDRPGLATAPAGPPPLVLNEWAARDLGVAPGAQVTLDFYLWRDEGRMDAGSATFRLAGVAPLAEPDDRALVPPYPGITESTQMADWSPPFPVDLARIRPADEDYWARHRTSPKAYVPLAVGQRLWGHRLGRVTVLRLAPAAGEDLAEAGRRFERALVPLLSSSLRPRPVRAEALSAARGSTDFGQYFVAFSFFLVASALLLAGLFFRLGLEQRLREVGLLRAVGFTPRRLLALFLGEGLLLAAAGALLGVLGALGYAHLVVLGLRTVWRGAVGTSELAVQASATALAAGALGAALAAALAVAVTLRGLGRRSVRALLAGALEDWRPERPPRARVLPGVLLALALLLLAAGAARIVPAAAAFFGAGGLLLAAALAESARRLRGRPARPAAVPTVAALGRRAASFRPGRSVLCIALVAGASFVIVAVGAFRHGGPRDLHRPRSESGGFTLLASAAQPLHHDPRTPAGREALGLPAGALDGVTLARFRRSAGDDASCLNLYRPSRPTVLGAEPSFLRAGRFAFAQSLAATPAERADPWLLLEREAADGVVPVVADGTTLQYVLKKRVGDTMALGEGGPSVRFVGALRPGLLQSALVTSERHFQRAFPAEDGYRFFLFDVPDDRAPALVEALESRLSDFGFDVSPAAAQLAAYHRVENTYIATFQTLGGLGLLLGTVGLAAVLVRNAFERRRELALLQAVGYRGRDLRRLVLSENALLLGAGLAAGVLPALLAILPALRERGGGAPLAVMASLVAALAVIGLAVSAAAAAAIRRLPLLASLRSE
jgi:hypothetical protein